MGALGFGVCLLGRSEERSIAIRFVTGLARHEHTRIIKPCRFTKLVHAQIPLTNQPQRSKHPPREKNLAPACPSGPGLPLTQSLYWSPPRGTPAHYSVPGDPPVPDLGSHRTHRNRGSTCARAPGPVFGPLPALPWGHLQPGVRALAREAGASGSLLARPCGRRGGGEATCPFDTVDGQNPTLRNQKETIVWWNLQGITIPGFVRVVQEFVHLPCGCVFFFGDPPKKNTWWYSCWFPFTPPKWYPPKKNKNKKEQKRLVASATQVAGLALLNTNCPRELGRTADAAKLKRRGRYG